MASSPSRNINPLLKYAPEERDHDVASDVMMAHQRGGQIANSRIENITLEEYRKPKDFPSTLYMSILLQGDHHEDSHGGSSPHDAIWHGFSVLAA